MPKFTDRQNREWDIQLDYGIAREVMAKHSINLLKIDEADPMAPIRDNPMTLCDVVQTLCKSQVDERDVAEDDFLRSLPMPPDPMIDAIHDAIVLVFPSEEAENVRNTLAKYAEVGEQTRKIALAKMTAAINDPRTEEAMKKLFDEQYEIQLAKMGM